MSAAESANEAISDRRAVRNVAANFMGRAGASLITFAAIPVFIRILDTESWGIVAFAISLSSLAAVFDLGFGASLSRELARRSAVAQESAARIDLLRSLELPLLLLALLAAALLSLCAGYFASSWLQYRTIAASDVQTCMRLAPVIVAMQMLIGFYSCGLQGLQRQYATSVSRLAFTLALYGGGCALLYRDADASIVDFFVWQVIVVALYCAGLRTYLYAALRVEGSPGRVQFGYIRDNLRYSSVVAGTSVLVVCLTQTDKLLLSHLLDLSDFGLYMLAFSVTSLQLLIVQPVQVALFPQFSALLMERRERAAGQKFMLWSQRVSLLVFPTGALLMVFSEELAYAWLRDRQIAGAISLPLSILAAGSMLNAVVTLPYALQLAAGMANLGFYCNFVGLVVMIPALILLTGWYGEIGAAAVWLLLNVGYTAVLMPLMFRRLIPEMRWRWYRDAFLYPCGISLSMMLAIRLVLVWSGAGDAAAIVAAGTGLLVAVALCVRLSGPNHIWTGHD